MERCSNFVATQVQKKLNIVEIKVQKYICSNESTRIKYCSKKVQKKNGTTKVKKKKIKCWSNKNIFVATKVQKSKKQKKKTVQQQKIDK